MAAMIVVVFFAFSNRQSGGSIGVRGSRVQGAGVSKKKERANN